MGTIIDATVGKEFLEPSQFNAGILRVSLKDDKPAFGHFKKEFPLFEIIHCFVALP